ncbi:carbohydrate-binding module family 18 protein, partial [Plenodomus tracheiphilus IPT5]
SSQSLSKNARCGAGFDGQTCTGSRYEDCCSRYFYCGSTNDDCRHDSRQVGYGRCN